MSDFQTSFLLRKLQIAKKKIYWMREINPRELVKKSYAKRVQLLTFFSRQTIHIGRIYEWLRS